MANEAVLKYLRLTNRPYSTNDIMLNLHKEFGKTAVQRALDTLVQQQSVLEKVYGKQKVYAIKQDPDADNKDDEIKELDEEIARLTAELLTVEENLKKAESEVKAVQTTLTTEEALRQMMLKEKEVSTMTTKLEMLRENMTPVSPKRMENAKATRDKFMKEYRNRKRLCTDVTDAILDGYPKPKKVFFEEVGIETDEEVDFNIQ